MSLDTIVRGVINSLLILSFLSVTFASTVVIENNQYKGIVIGIHHSVPETGSDELIDAIKEAWTSASRNLFVATENRAYFGEITILVPKSWTNSKYEAAETECYDHADAIVAPENPLFGDVPYTTQYGGCGEKGERMHFTPRYMTDDSIALSTGKRGKTIVHEWAHYRWGVFDEVSDANPFYFEPNYRLPIPTGCPSHVVQNTGTVYNYVSNRTCDGRDIDTATNSYSDECVYLPESNTTDNVSLMSFGYLDKVVAFCKDDIESGEQGRHNVVAPNDQNRLCNLKSTWTVIMESPDFLSSENERNDSIVDTTPIFNVVQRQTKDRYVLVLDVSSSMNLENRLKNMRLAANYFISTAVPNGSYVGLVVFSTDAYILREMSLLTTVKSRQNLSADLPMSASGSTSIGDGISQGLWVLQNDGASAAGGNLVVFTDGEENEPAYIVNVYRRVVNQKVVVSTVFLATTANEILVDLTHDTGGMWFFANDNNQEYLINSFNEISVQGGCESSSTYQLHSDFFALEDNNNEPYWSTVYVDSSIGLNTVFTFSWSYDAGLSPSDVVVTSPHCAQSSSPLPSCFDQTNYEFSPEFHSLRITVPGLAETGEWSYIIRPKNGTQYITAVVSSMAREDGVEPIEVASNIVTDFVLPPKIYASVTQAYQPVLGASVIAIVEQPFGDFVSLELRDNGAGCDIRENDGIYSRYFTNLTDPGRYSVQIQVSKNTPSSAKVTGGSASNYRSGTVDKDGNYWLNPNGVKSPLSRPSQGASVTTFTRVKAAGGFRSRRSVNSSNPFPPGQVTDIIITQTDIQNFSKGLTVKFTATGENYDSGTAASYDLKYTYGNPEDLLNNFDDQISVNQSDVLKGNLSSPLSAGNRETIVINIIRPTDNASVISVAVKARDKSGVVSEISNIAITTVYVTPPLKLPIPVTTTPYITTTPPLVLTEVFTAEKTDENSTLRTNDCNIYIKEDNDENSRLYFILMIVFAVTTAILAFSTFGLLYRMKRNKAEKSKKTKMI